MNVFDAASKFFESKRRRFPIVENGKLVGRIAAIKNDMHLKYHNDDTGFFGFFECIKDQEVANALFDKAANQLHNSQ